ncbi:LPS export ABC transporter permease LptG [Teredinibacter turnerae]|uniref:SecD export membrane protein n=1 Tax=Teredinibacter turnerae (strain ATCC 39867 / T7901) TaxID=377629 RepID=C5BMG4_TERTT|nr:LPS export ABC transporter permease LptG [Teredinibacter turnerae]ACR14504.1 SecD export membrane protein [Teredinibacter turnerae T7901]
MRKLQRYIAAQVWGSVMGVLLVIVSLDAIADLVDQLSQLKGDYTFLEALFYVVLYIPSSVCDYLPLAALVGCLIGLGLLANSSELVVMRAAGVSVRQLIWSVMRPVLLFIIVGALVGEYVSPYTDQYADSRRDLLQGHERALQSERGLWFREGSEYMHFNAVLPNGRLYGITRYKFADGGRLEQASFIRSAIYQGDHWVEQGGEITQFDAEDKVDREEFISRNWYTEISPSLLNVLVLDPDELPMQRLYAYANYQEKQNIDSSEYRLAFWQKALQPLATLSLVMIAISFIFGPLRQTTMGFRVFIGVIVGLVFQTSQKLFGPMSIIMGFSPMFAVLIPIAFCFAFGWLLIKRSQ